MKSKLPWESTILENAAFLDPRKKNSNGSLSAISNITLQIFKPLETILSKFFPHCSTKEDVCDKVRSEWKVYQMELIPESCYLEEETSSSLWTSRWWRNSSSKFWCWPVHKFLGEQNFKRYWFIKVSMYQIIFQNCFITFTRKQCSREWLFNKQIHDSITWHVSWSRHNWSIKIWIVGPFLVFQLRSPYCKQLN